MWQVTLRSSEQCSRKRVQQLEKNKKSCFWILKTLKKRTHSFTSHLITQPLITTGKSRSPWQHQVSCSKCGHKKLCNLDS